MSFPILCFLLSLALIFIFRGIPLSSPLGAVLGSERSTNKIAAEVSESSLRETVSWLQSLGNRSAWEKQQQVSHWALDRLKGYGLEVREHWYEFRGETWRNVVAFKKGSRLPDEGVLLMAHLDSITRGQNKQAAPGADDNGSGVAVLLENARVLAETPLERTILFCLFSNEERGAAGSQAYVQSFKNEGVKLQAAINLDLLGYNNTEELIPWEAVSAQDTLKYKVKALWRGIKNYRRTWVADKDTVKVAGREPNRGLAMVVSQSLVRYGGIKAGPLIGKDCG